VLFAPIFNHLADRVRWRTLIPASAAFFALNLVVFRAAYQEGSALFGMVFYGWYDLFAAALVTQFFMAVQLFFNARDAKAAVPLVIAVGSLGVVFGSLITGFLAEAVGTPNLMLVAAAFVSVFAVAVSLLWTGETPVRTKGRNGGGRGGLAAMVRDLQDVFSHRHILLIARLVLVTVVVKQIVDYEFNEAVRVFLGNDRDSISSFQGYVIGVQNALPILVLLPLGPLLKRYGVGLAVMILPVAMLGFTGGLALAFGVWTAVLAKAGDSMFRYSAERTAREVLYVPVPTELKLKAKAYVDVAVEKGFGKAFSGVLIFVLTLFMDYRSVIWIAVILSVAWCYMAWAAKREYIAVLGASIRGRFANLIGTFASLTERSTLAMVEEALRSGDTVQVEFGLDLVEQAGTVDAQHLSDELELLLEHPDAGVRARSLRLLGRFPELVRDARIQHCLEDDSEEVAEAAVGALVSNDEGPAAVEATLAEILGSPHARVRLAALSWMSTHGGDDGIARRLADRRIRAVLPNAGDAGWVDAVARAEVDVRRELALAAGLADGPLGLDLLARLLGDEDDGVSDCAIRSVGRAGSAELRGRLVSMLADPAARGRVKDGLVRAGPGVVEVCRSRLLAPDESASVRKAVAEVLAHVPDEKSVESLLAVVGDSRAPWKVRFASLKALNRLRARAHAHGDLTFDRDLVWSACDAMVAEASVYLSVAAALDPEDARREPSLDLLRSAAWEAWTDRREAAFRLLGLVFPPDDVYRSHGTLGGADDRKKANALEWLERTLGHALFRRVLPVLDGTPAAGGKDARGAEARVESLASDPDPWIAELAGRSAQRPGGDSMDVIGKAFLLQKVDLLEGARSAHLGLLASISEEVEAEAGEVLVRAGEPNDALYVIVRGSVELSGVGNHKLSATDGTAFGTWSLIDSAPSVVAARALEPTRVLRITRGDFQELLSDHPELATGMLQALARRLRSLVA
jgi:hypothetical protein